MCYTWFNFGASALSLGSAKNDLNRTVPLVAVFTPGTLTVQEAAHPKETVYRSPIPPIDYNAIEHFWLPGEGTGERFSSGPSTRLNRLMAAVTSQGSILHLTAPAPNSYFSLEFFGPSISCGPSTSVTVSDLSHIVRELDLDYDVVFVGWVPHPNPHSEDDTSIKVSALRGLNHTLIASSGPWALADIVSSDYARLYVAFPASSIPPPAPIECGLYNSSFHVKFNFSDGHQDLQIINTTRVNAISINRPYDCDAWDGSPGSCGAAESSYIYVLGALAAYVIGRVERRELGLSYAVGTHVMGSIFTQTQELHKIFNEEPLSIANVSMAAALEKVFTNATLSLFSDSYFL